MVLPTSPMVAIVAPADGTHVRAGASITFTGSATDATDGDLSAGLQWTSDLDGPIGSGGSFSTAGLSIGSHTITAAVSDAGGLSGRATHSVVVRGANTAPALTIDAPFDGSTLLAGKPMLLAATASDPEDGDLRASVHWTSSRDGNLGTGGAVVVPSLGLGTHTLTATVTDPDGATSTTSIGATVIPSTLTFTPVADTYVDSSATSS